MFDYNYLIEILTPKRSTGKPSKDEISLFDQKYRRIFESGCGVSVPDNPMGKLRHSLVEMLRACDVTVDPEKTVMNLNTFHAKEALDRLLTKALDMGIKNLLVVRGDGGPELDKLDPASIGGKMNIATSTELIRYINTEYSNCFNTGAAFNQFNRPSFELDRFRQKIDAGAKFAITQPVIGRDENVDSLIGLGLPVIIEAWMSKNIELLFKSVRKEIGDEPHVYDPVENLKALHEAYPEHCVYLSMLGFKSDWKTVLPRL